MRGRRGLTLVELAVATGLLAVLLLALVRLVDTSLDVWRDTESRRDLFEQSSALADVLGDALRGVEPGARGDLLVDWAAHDVDGDGITGLPLQRVRLVRRATRAEEALLGEGALVEAAFALLPPGKDGRADGPGRLVGALRAADGDAAASLLDPAAFDARGELPAALARELSRSVLWMELLCASQATVLDDGWHTGEGTSDAATAWDAWTAGRADEDLTPLNRPSAGAPPADGVPVLPRRVRLSLELERERDLARRTRLAAPVGPLAKELVLVDPRFAPPAGVHARVGEEWVRVTASRAGRLAVERGARGTRALDHAAGELVHFGAASVREQRIDVLREDWNL